MSNHRVCCCGSALGGCRCGVAPEGITNWTPHFANCVGRYTPSTPPILLPGEADENFGVGYPAKGWNAPVVKISGTLEQTYTDTNPSIDDQSINMNFSAGTLIQVIRNSPLCLNFRDYQPAIGDPGYSTRLVQAYSYVDATGPQSSNLDISLGHIDIFHNYGYPNDALADCSNLANTAYNLLLRIQPPNWGPFARGRFDFFAATGNNHPCFGAGHMATNLSTGSGAYDTSHEDLTDPVMAGDCDSFTIRWAGSYSVTKPFGIYTLDWTADWDITLTFENMDGCPEEPGI